MIIFLLIVVVLFILASSSLSETNSNSNNQNENSNTSSLPKIWKNQEQANMYEYGWDEPECTEFRNEEDSQSYEHEKLANYEYDYEEDANEFGDRENYDEY